MNVTSHNARMGSHTAKPFVRAIQVASVITLAFSGCPWAAESGGSPPSTNTERPAATSPVAPHPADKAPAAAAPAATPAPGAPAPPARAAVEPSPACKAYIAVLSGRKKDPKALDDPELQAIATPELVMCGAVFSDSDELCKRLMPPEKGPSAACLRMRALFHELRAYPGKPSFMFDELSWQECRATPALTAFCDSLQQALRSGKPEDCDRVGDGRSLCRASMTLDKSLCTMTGKLAEVEISRPDHKEGESATMTAKEAAEDSCRENIDNLAVLAKGLPTLAASGPPRERELAKAALQQPDACETYAQAARQRCAPPPQTPAASEGQAPAAPDAAGRAPVGQGAPPAVPEKR